MAVELEGHVAVSTETSRYNVILYNLFNIARYWASYIYIYIYIYIYNVFVDVNLQRFNFY